jgi:hypothetical protein
MRFPLLHDCQFIAVLLLSIERTVSHSGNDGCKVSRSTGSLVEEDGAESRQVLASLRVDKLAEV